MKSKIVLMLSASLMVIWQVQAQPYTSCSEPAEHTFPSEETLCKIHEDFDADVEILASSSSELNDNYFEDQDVYISGLFNIDSWILFYNCRILMAPGASIFIHPHGQLGFWQTDVFACEQRWLGITVSNGGYLVCYHSKFEDADYLIRVNSVKSRISLANNVFNRNYIGIQVQATSPSDFPVLNFYTFSGNTFDCTSPLLEKWDNNLPDADVSLVGIQTELTSGTIGQFNGTNLFQNMQHGIYAERSRLAIRQCQFHNMVRLTQTGTDGSGIYANNSSLSITDNPNDSGGSIGSEFINNERAGVLAMGTVLHIEDCDFEAEDEFAINSSQNLTGEFVLIQNNRFIQQNGTCIFLQRSAGSLISSHTNTIANNTFEYEQSNGQNPCIAIVTNNMSTDIMSVSDNTPFTLIGEEAPYGISIRSNNSDNNFLIENEIDIQAAGASWGIEMQSIQNVFGSYIYDNTVTSESSEGAIGFGIQNTPNLRMCSNSTENLQYGHYLVGSNDAMNFSLNTMEDHDIGLLVQGIGGMPGVMGPQFRTANQWFTPFSGFAAQNQSDPDLSLFFIHDPSNAISLPTQIDPSSGWFVSDEGTEESCYGGPTPYEPELTSFDTIVLDSNFASPWPTDPAIWELNRRLIYKMKRFPELQARAGTYYADDSTTTYGLLAEVDYRFFLAMQIDTVKFKTLDSLRLEIDTLFLEISEIDTVKTPPSDTIVIDPQKDSVKYALLLEITDLDSLSQLLRSQIRTTQISMLDDVLDFNDTITVVEEWEINQKAVNHFMIRVARGDTLQTEDLDSLRVIAGTCIADGGFATLAASAFLPICEWVDYEDVVCERSSKENVGGAKEFSTLQKVYPNPASSLIHFEFGARFSGSLLLIDADGKSVRHEFISESESHVINTTDLSGIYFYQLKNKHDHVTISGKVIISR